MSAGAQQGGPVEMADSGEENLAERPAKRQKRFTFQRFSQRVAQVRKQAKTLWCEKAIIVIALRALDSASNPSCRVGFAQCQEAALYVGGRRCIPSPWQCSPRALAWIHLLLSGGYNSTEIDSGEPL